MFKLLPADDETHHARHDETLIALAAEQGPHACIWETSQGLVVPRTYQRFSPFQQACEDFAAQGWPITVRQSGGGIVPQGPGILNLSLAYAVQGKPLDHSDDAYLLICRVIGEALQDYGVAAQPQAVEGSFCDGRYNLAVGSGDQARKIAGTAQLWRRHPASPGADHGGAGHRGAGHRSAGHRQVVLVHALILASIDVAAITRLANRFEQAIGSDKRYDAQRAVSLSELCAPGAGARQLAGKLKQSLARRIAAI
ncbi:MAG: lipoate--protein ligase family protein [Burkholderiaceae bacterium]